MLEPEFFRPFVSRVFGEKTTNCMYICLLHIMYIPLVVIERGRKRERENEREKICGKEFGSLDCED